jgi:protein ImuB
VSPVAVSIPRLGVLHCPHWPVFATGASPHEPVAVVRANRVVAHTLAAGTEGVVVGQRRREAQGRCPRLRLEAADGLRDARAFDAVVRAVGQLVPRLEVTEPGTLAFMARGPSRYFGGEHGMAAAVLEAASTVVGQWGLGVADGRFAAGIAARRAAVCGTPQVVPAGVVATQRFLQRLPVGLLAEVGGVPADLVGLFQRLGLPSLGHLADLPEVDVVARFGPVGGFAHRLAAGGDDRLPGTHDPPPGTDVERVFEPPVQHSDSVVFAARQLADDVVTRLSAEGRVCTRLVVTAETEHGERCDRTWYRSSGLSAAAMVERVRWQLDAWAQSHTLTAGISLLRLHPAEVCADDGVQMGLWGGRSEADDWAARAVTRLMALVGEQQVLVPIEQGGRQPGDTHVWVSAASVDLAEPERSTGVGGPWPGSLPAPSPAEVFPAPLEAEVLDAQGRPVVVTGRGLVSAAPSSVRFDSQRHGVSAWAGPWPVDERWWDPARSRRVARLQLLTAEGRLLLACVERGRWWVTAEYR